jgi:hypothetical protein
LAERKRQTVGNDFTTKNTNIEKTRIYASHAARRCSPYFAAITLKSSQDKYEIRK